MQLKLAKGTWGMDGTFEEQIRRIADSGYSAVEMPVPMEYSAAQVKKVLKDFHLDLIAMIFTGGENHVDSFRLQIERASWCDPLQVTSHSGKDFWSTERQRAFFTQALEIERKIGLEINHETHRGRAMCNPWNTAALLNEFLELHIVADFSHFVCVCESLLVEPSLAKHLEICICRSRHIHGRVGFEEGPQVNDPRAPEWAAHVAAHEIWWNAIARARFVSKASCLTFNPEFGPPNYMQALPHSRMPVADCWDVCLYMGSRFRDTYAELFPTNS